ncbi:alpha/beta fold hydrolase [Sphingomonas colocasiae]|uniref:Alpha/beta hydrolase n=1 Tax=Sphingomonas colocasiae TaxID=1848973 RepID=A0ABS7PZ70_9SPHN|nr:alpha/beta hydrolase [Sphingomonas colocasiae]MBY8825632.1 alpha/beta hydrolase [Sphingomonas colocasiae]
MGGALAFREIELVSEDGLRLAGDVCGVAQGQSILLLHGGGQSRSAWRGAARRLAAAGYRACSLDLRGHGDSDWSPDAAYGLDAFVADLVIAVEAVGAPAILVGASFGGHVAMLTAARRPDLCRALLLADVTPWIDETVGDHFRDTLRTSADGFASVEDAAAMIARLHGDPAAVADPARLLRHMRVGDGGRLRWKWDMRFLNDAQIRRGGEQGLFVSEALGLRVPVLVMAAELSNLTSPAEIEAFRDAVPGVEAVTIAGARHMLTGDVNDAYAEAILAFVARLGDPVADS